MKVTLTETKVTEFTLSDQLMNEFTFENPPDGVGSTDYVGFLKELAENLGAIPTGSVTVQLQPGTHT